MSKEVLTHSESYVKKTNRIILVVGLTSFVIFVIGVMLLMQSGPVQEDYTEPVFTDNDDALNISNDTGPTDNIEFGVVDDGEPPITTTPNPVQMGQVVLGTDAKNVLTLGTNAKPSKLLVPPPKLPSALFPFSWPNRRLTVLPLKTTVREKLCAGMKPAILPWAGRRLSPETFKTTLSLPGMRPI